MKKKFETFGHVVRALRLKHNLTQAEVAKMIGCHTQTISNAERGIAAYPKPEAEAFVRKIKIRPHDREWLLNALVADAEKEARAEWSKPLNIK